MCASTQNPTSRREFIINTGRLAAASALAGVSLPAVHAAGTDAIQLALIGCGGRGTGAAGDALSSKNGPTKLVAMADVFEDRLSRSFESLKSHFGAKLDVPADRKFLGFDAYQKAMDCLRPGDVAIFATPPAFRWVHFGYAIQKELNVFMEKPVTVDAPTTRKLFTLAEASEKKNLKVGVGLMIRHCAARKALNERITAGEIGEITMLRAYRMAAASALARHWPPSMNELQYQIRHFHSFLWASGGIFSDYNIHQIDECCWMKGAWPVRAHSLGGRHYRGESLDQNFDNYAVEYTFPDGTKLWFGGRAEDGCHDEFASYAHGTKGSAVISTAAHHPGRCRVFKGYNITRADMTWAFPQPEPSPYQLEWDDLLQAIRQNQPYNEAKRGATASLVTSMGRMAAHTGQVITYEDLLKGEHEFAPEVDKLAMNSPAPLQLGPDGKYPVPEPGIKKDREY
jgi:predicted dehydrogenase